MRLVSLCPSLTELVFDLGRGDDLVGITKWCVHPVGAVDAVEKVGGTKDPDVARIVALAPDLVLMNDEENRLEDARALEAAGLRVLSSLPKDCADTAAMVRGIATALGRSTAGEAVALEIERRAARVRAAAQGRAPVRFAYVIWRKPWMAAGADTFASALLTQAGGVNVFDEPEPRYPEFDPAGLAGREPDRVLLGSEPFPFTARHVEELARLTGLSSERILTVDGEYLSWHGSRTPDGIDHAEACLLGDPHRAPAGPSPEPTTDR